MYSGCNANAGPSGVGELGEEIGSGSSGLGAAGVANEEQQEDKARIAPLGAGLAALQLLSVIRSWDR